MKRTCGHEQVSITGFVLKSIEAREQVKLAKLREGLLTLVALIDDAHPTTAEITDAGWAKVREVEAVLTAARQGDAPQEG